MPTENAPSAVPCEPCGWGLPFLTPVPGSPSCTVGPPASQDHLGVRAEGHPAQGSLSWSIEDSRASLGGHRTSTEKRAPHPLREPHTPPRPRHQPIKQRLAQRWRQAVQLLQCVRAGPEIFLLHGRTGGVLTRPPHYQLGPLHLCWVCRALGPRDLGSPPRNVCTVGCGQRVSQMLFQEDCAGKSVFSGLAGVKDSGEARGCGGRGRTCSVTRLLGLPCPSALLPCFAPRRGTPLVRCAPGWLVPISNLRFSCGAAACLLSHVQLFATLWTEACQAPLAMGFPRQEYLTAY